jgi:acetyl-CoA synthetase/medium-chain acyl-CoA synthetase
VRQTFRWAPPEFFNFGRDVIDVLAGHLPDEPAMLWVGPKGERQVTWRQIAQRSSQLAGGLRDLGLERGERVLIILPRLVEWWEALLGALKAGLVAIPGTPLLTPHDIAYRVGAADVSAVIADSDGAAKVQHAANELPTLQHRIVVAESAPAGWQTFEQVLGRGSAAAKPVDTPADDPALCFFTSGTTGMPKMVLHTHASYGLGHTVTGRLWLDLQPGDLHWNLSDTGWAKAAWSSLFGPWLAGATLFVHHQPGKFDPADVLKHLATRPITSFCAAPTIYRLLVQQDLRGFRPAKLRSCVAAGEPLNPTVIDAWRQATGLTIRDGYGQTETVLLCGNFPGVPVKLGSMGLPTPGFDLAVIDDEGRRLPPGGEGAIAVATAPERPLPLFREYWRNPEANAESFRDPWYVTGDRGYVDEDGYFWFVGRADDVITSSAYRIGPFEVESALMSHPSVAEAAVIGKPDPVRGEIVKAFVVLKPGGELGPGDALIAQLQEHVKQTTAPYKYPREIEFVAELPKTVSGKVRRNELRRREQTPERP